MVGRIFAFVVDVISIYEPLSNIDRRIPEVGRQYQAKPQCPVADSHGRNLPLARVQ